LIIVLRFAEEFVLIIFTTKKTINQLIVVNNFINFVVLSLRCSHFLLIILIKVMMVITWIFNYYLNQLNFMRLFYFNFIASFLNSNHNFIVVLKKILQVNFTLLKFHVNHFFVIFFPTTKITFINFIANFVSNY